MLQALKSSLSLRVALRHVRRRPARPWEPDPEARRVLVVLPSEVDELKAAWRLVQELGLEPGHVTPVIMGEAIPYAPAGYIGRVRTLGAKQRTPLGLPKKAAARALWDESPDVALCLAPPADLAVAYLVGASPAAFRAGMYSEGLEPFFDLMTASADSYEAALALLREALRRVTPSVLPPAP